MKDHLENDSDFHYKFLWIALQRIQEKNQEELYCKSIAKLKNKPHLTRGTNENNVQ